jgi:hypothetical protein
VATEQIYRLKVTLRNVRPPVWRRVEMPGRTTLTELHSILQTVMPWCDEHLHDFEIDGVRYGAPDDGWEDDELRDESKVRLDDVAAEGTTIRYTYDFGDDWRHDVVVEKVLPAEGQVQYPRCLTGRRATPPEDIGGGSGYEQFLETMADPGHPDHEELREWIGQDWDPDHFEVDSVNEALKRCP